MIPCTCPSPTSRYQPFVWAAYKRKIRARQYPHLIPYLRRLRADAEMVCRCPKQTPSFHYALEAILKASTRLMTLAHASLAKPPSIRKMSVILAWLGKIPLVSTRANSTIAFQVALKSFSNSSFGVHISESSLFNLQELSTCCRSITVTSKSLYQLGLSWGESIC
jgi:hypothetical protein